MGFSGGGSGVLLNHNHDGTLALDGGPLDFKNITQGSMSAGSLCFSDGVHLQELAIGTPAQQLLVNAGATAVEWSSQHSEVWKNIFGANQSVAAPTFDTGVMNGGTKLRWLHIQAWIATAGADTLDLRMGDGTINTTANYHNNVIYNATSTKYAGETFGRMTNASTSSSTSINIFLDNNPDDMNRWNGINVTSNDISEVGGFLNVTAQADRIEIRTNGGANIGTTSYMQVFGAA